VFSLYLFGRIIRFLAGILYFVVTSVPIRLHQSNQAHSTTCLALIFCKYQVPYFIPNCSNLFIYNLLTLSVPCEGFSRNAYMLWVFWCVSSFCWYWRNCLNQFKSRTNVLSIPIGTKSKYFPQLWTVCIKYIRPGYIFKATKQISRF
jgi:hypothetical protein